MTTLKTFRRDGMTDEEIYEVMEGVKQWEWTHSITTGVAGRDISYGDIWQSAHRGAQKLRQLDKNVRYAFWICTNIREDGSEGRPHLHGIISTTLLTYQINSCFYTYGKKSYDLKRFSEDNPLDGWLKYLLPQAVRGATITNISPEEYA